MLVGSNFGVASTINASDEFSGYSFLEGDSITSQHTTGTTIYNGIGYVNALNALSYNRFPYIIGENYGIGGGTLVTMEAEKATLAAATGKYLIFLGGANDVGVASPDLSAMKTAFLSEKSYVLNTLRKGMIVSTILPRTQDLGVALTGTQLTALKDFNAWLLAQNDPANRFIAINTYDGMCSATDTPNPLYFKDESGKLLHPNIAGSIAMARLMWRYLQSIGFSRLNVPSSNLFTFGNMTGTGGTLGANATGVVADGITISGSGGTQTRLCSVSATGQRVRWTPISGDGASANVKVSATTNILRSGGSYAIGDTLLPWAEVRILDALRMDGPYVQVTETGTPSTAYIGFNKAGATTGFMPSDAGTLFMVGPQFVVPATNVSLKPEVICQAECLANAGIVDFEVIKMGVTKL